MNNIIETNWLAAAVKLWNNLSLKLKTLEGRIAYVHEQEKRHTGNDYSSYPSAKDYAYAMKNAIIKKYNA